MNVNLSGASATPKGSVSESSSKASAESSEKQGFLQTLSEVFTDAQKPAQSNAKLDAAAKNSDDSQETLMAQGAAKTGESNDSSSRQTISSNQETPSDGKGKHASQSADVLLTQDAPESVQDSTSNSATTSNSVATPTAKDEVNGSDNVVASVDADTGHLNASAKVKTHTQEPDVDAHSVADAMGQGQQLLGRISQANQTLQAKEMSHSRAENFASTSPESKSVDTADLGVAMSGSEGVAIGDMAQKHGNNLPLDANTQLTQANNGTQANSGLTSDGTTPMPEQSSANSESQAFVKPVLDSEGNPIEMTERQVKSSPIEWQMSDVQDVNQAKPSAQTVTMPIDAVSSEFNPVQFVQTVPLQMLDLIDTKLAQGQPLTSQEIDVIEGLKTGELVADIPEQELAQFVALPNELKVAISEHNAARLDQPAVRSSSHAAVAQAASQLVPQDVKQAALQIPVNNLEKSALSAMPEALVAANVHSAAQMVSHNDDSRAALTATAGVLKAATEKQDKIEPQHGLAGQLQAATGQQGVATPQQARVDFAQQAQLPLQLTKELANDQVAEKVQMMMSKNLKNLDIRLDPPELGRMQIRMTMNNDLANVHFTVTNPQARDMIEQTLPRLREMLAQQGMQLADSSVQQQSSGQQQSGYAASHRSGQGNSEQGFSGVADESVDGGVNLDLKVAQKRDGISFYA